ncbi:HTH domain-containing protein [Mannheimia pernigra]|uniref:HTH domain-containing protein n=1 Tax=Mannheimia pernigra TaxID=111844 RepID=A0A7D5IBP8_9PAST|nr:HTH domain-containing protein [Mannheimia pernigra]QLB41233.1 HTH domain-containing protein [Mannheimia pernigra]
MSKDIQADLKKILALLSRNRRFQSLFLLLLRNQQFINSDALSSELHLSVRTVKKDIKLLKEKLEPYGIQIFSRPCYGYKLLIQFEELHMQLKQYFQISQPITINNKFESRVNAILRRLMVSQVALRVEDFQSELYLSFTSALTKEFSQVKTLLGKYGLILESKPHYGMKIVGETYRKIMLTVRLYKYFTQLEHPFGIKEFEQRFTCSITDRVRETLAKSIIHFNVVFSDIYAERFIIYLRYFYNQQPELSLPYLNFNYQQTNEYRFVIKLLEQLSELDTRFNFNPEVIQFLTYIAISSTDLYRFKDCNSDNYPMLLDKAWEIHHFIFTKFTDYLNLEEIHDDTCHKDLLKMLIPIVIKIMLGVSDDVDLGLFNQTELHRNPILSHTVEKLVAEIEKNYGYSLSIREQYFIFDIFSGMINRIELERKPLRLALIALNGRLSTQQLKRNIKRYFSDYILKIETKVLYELAIMEEKPYDYYLCNEYGKNMTIPYEPIYFADSSLTENEYATSLNEVFYHAYQYDEVLPKIKSIEIEEQYRLNEFNVEQEYLNYEQCILENKQDKIKLFYQLNSVVEKFEIYYFKNKEDFTLYGYTKFIVIGLNVIKQPQKLKMILNIINNIAHSNCNILPLCLSEKKSYKFFFTTKI